MVWCGANRSVVVVVVVVVVLSVEPLTVSVGEQSAGNKSLLDLEF